jgi:formylglycine-generating enzyme required for sulfatase activity
MFTRILLAIAMCGMAHAADWVPIKGGVLQPGIRLDDFEMLDHPVTNAEYKLFVDDAKYPAPPYWDRGRIPAGMENLPVVFVSRYADVAAYTKWRTAKEGRAYRLPTMYGM